MYEAKANSIRMASSRAIRAKVLSKSIPSSWLYPLATNLALFLITFPASSNLVLKTHFVPITKWLLGLEVSVQTQFCSN